MANKNSFKDKHRKNHKKDKKKKKSKKSKHRSNPSASISSDSEVTPNYEILEKSQDRTEWGFLDTVLSDSYVTVKDKEQKSNRIEADKLKQNIRELNPYWKDGGCGLPPINEIMLKGKEEASDHSSLDSTSFHKDHSSNQKYRLQYKLSSDSRKVNFLKPGISSEVEISKSFSKGNWKKKELKEPQPIKENKPKASEYKKDKNKTDTSKSVLNEDLNKLAAKLVKAEIMGNTALINKLKLELEVAKKAKDNASCSKEKSGAKCKEIVILTDTVLKKAYDTDKSQVGSKRQKVINYDLGQRTCYFPDDDKYSLKNLFQKEKEGFKNEILLPLKLTDKSSEEIDDIYLEAAASGKMQQKMEKIKKQKEIKETLVKYKTFDGCHWCLENRSATKHLIISTGSKCYLCLPEQESLTKGHCVIVPFQHEISMMHLDEDVWNEIKTYQKVLTQMFSEQEQEVVFFENARSFNHFPHCVIQCIPLCKEMGDLAPIYFQKAISESETEWSNNKKLINFRQKDLRRSIPKGLPYFAVTFGTSGGFAHIIEDEYLFKRNFAEEVLGGMMDLDHKKWHKQQMDNFKTQREKTLEFLKIWKKFEFNENLFDSESSSSS